MDMARTATMEAEAEWLVHTSLRQYDKPPLVHWDNGFSHVRLFGGKPLSKPRAAYCLFDNWGHI